MPVTPSTYPTTIDVLSNPDETTYANDPGYELDEVVARAQDIMEALQYRLGAILADDASAGYVLAGDAAGGSAYVPATALQNALIQGCPLPLQQEGNGPFTSATTPANTDGSYIFDAWFVLSDGNDIVDLSVVTTGLPLGARAKYRLDVETINKKAGIFQIVELADIADFLEAGQASLSFDHQIVGTSIAGVRAAIFCWSSTADSPTKDLVSAWGAAGTIITPVSNWAVATGGDSGVIVPTTSWVTDVIAGATIPSNTTNIAVGIWIDDVTTTLTDFLELTNICLVPGPVPLKVARRPVSEEQRRTLRLIEIFKATAINGGFASGNVSSATAGLLMLTYLPKRVAPPTANSVSALSDFTLADGGAAPAVTSMTLVGPTAQGKCTLNVGASGGGLTTGRSGMLLAANTNALMRIDARLGV